MMRWLEDKAYKLLGVPEYPYTHPSGDKLRHKISDDELARTSNDGYELWIGTADEWRWHCRAPQALSLARFIIWNWWIKATWCGARRWLWYKLLSRKCLEYRLYKP